MSNYRKCDARHSGALAFHDIIYKGRIVCTVVDSALDSSSETGDHIHRLVDSANACDAAGIVNPDALPDAIAAIENALIRSDGYSDTSAPKKTVALISALRTDIRAALASLRAATGGQR